MRSFRCVRAQSRCVSRVSPWVALPWLLCLPALGQSPAARTGQALPPALRESQTAPKPASHALTLVKALPAKPAAPPSTAPKMARVKARFLASPLRFEGNAGQTDARVKFLARGDGYSLFLTPTEAVFALRKPAEAQAKDAKPNPLAALLAARRLAGTPAGSASPATPVAPGAKPAVSAKAPIVQTAASPAQARAAFQQALQEQLKALRETKPATPAILRMQLVGASAAPEVAGQQPLPGKANYIRGSDPKQWHTGVQAFAQVQYRGVYPGIDLLYYGNQTQLEYDFQVHPRADVAAIRLGFVGADAVAVDKDGNLALTIGTQTLVEHKPVIYQEVDGKRQPVAGQYVLRGAREAGFDVGDYDHKKPLVIDPILVYATYWGGISGDGSASIAVDAAGYTYITGYASTGDDFPTANTVAIAGGVFVTKFAADGEAVVYSTYLGGTGSSGDLSYGIAVDPAGCAYVAGQTFSADFPTTANAVQRTMPNTSGTSSGFVTKLSADGSALVYSTFLGGSGSTALYAGDTVTGIAVDGTGQAYVVGTTFSADFPFTANAFQKTNRGIEQAFVTKFSVDGSSLVYSTYLGGSPGNDGSGGYNVGNGIAVDATGCAYVTGGTDSSDFPIQDAVQPVLNGVDAFVTKLNAAGSAPVYSTFLGGSGFSSANGIAVDGTGQAYVVGLTTSADFPFTANAFQKTNLGIVNAFVTKLNAAGSSLVYSTYLGGSDTYRGDSGTGIAVDTAGHAYVTGTAFSWDFPITPNAFQPAFAGASTLAFVTKLSPDGSSLDYSSFLGGTIDSTGNATCDYGAGIAVDGAGNAYVAGGASSIDFPFTFDALQKVNYSNSAGTAFLAKISSGILSAPTGLMAAPGSGWVSLAWQPVDGADTYNVYRATLGLPYTLIAPGLAPVGNYPSYADLSVTNGTTYYYVVTAVSADGESLYSPEANATPNANGTTYGGSGGSGSGGNGGSGTGGSGSGSSGGSSGSGGSGGSGSGGSAPTQMILPVQSLTLNDETDLTVPGGTGCVGTVTLSQKVQPGCVVVVNLTNSNPSAALISHTVKIYGDAESDQDKQSTTFAVDASTVNRPVTVTISAFTDAHPATTTLTIMPRSLHVSDIFMPNTIQLSWDQQSQNGGFVLKRDGTPVPNFDPNAGFYDDYFTNGFVNGQPHVYTLYDGTGPNAPLISAETVVPYKSATNADQAVDSRLDPRQPVRALLLNHPFGASAYRGGLFVGHAEDTFFDYQDPPYKDEDASRVGRSFARFPLGAWPLSSPSFYPAGAFLRAGTVNAYLTRLYADQNTGATYMPSLALVPLTTNAWDAPSLTWVSAPSLENAPVGNAVNPAAPGSVTPDPSMENIPHPAYAGWLKWPLNDPITSALTGGRPLSVGWRLPDETLGPTNWGWAYLSKLEYNANLAPAAMHAWTVPTLGDLLVVPLDQPDDAYGQVLVNGVGAGEGQVTVNLSSSAASATTLFQQVTVPDTITVSGLSHTFHITWHGPEQYPDYPNDGNSYHPVYDHFYAGATITATFNNISISKPWSVEYDYYYWSPDSGN